MKHLFCMRIVSSIIISLIISVFFIYLPASPAKAQSCDPLPLGQMRDDIQEGEVLIIRFIPSGDSAPASEYSLTLELEGVHYATRSFFDDGRSYKVTFDNLPQGSYTWTLSQTGRGTCSSGSFTVGESLHPPDPLAPITAFSDVLDPVGGTFGTLGGIISKALPFVFGFAALIALLFLIWGGFRYMTAQGDEKAVAEARQTITSAIIGLVIILAVVALAQLLEIVFRINIIG